MEHFLTWDNFWLGFVQVMPLVIVSYGVGLLIEFIFAVIKGHEVEEGYLVTGMLVPLIVPVDTPLWMLAVAVVFGVVIGKEVFGGTGMNILNPALTIRAFLFFAYPTWMSGDQVWVHGSFTVSVRKTQTCPVTSFCVRDAQCDSQYSGTALFCRRRIRELTLIIRPRIPEP